MGVAIIDRLRWRAPFSRYIQYGVKRSAPSLSTLALLSFISVVHSMAQSTSCRSCFDSCCSDTSGAFIRKWFSWLTLRGQYKTRERRAVWNEQSRNAFRYCFPFFNLKLNVTVNIFKCGKTCSKSDSNKNILLHKTIILVILLNFENYLLFADTPHQTVNKT